MGRRKKRTTSSRSRRKSDSIFDDMDLVVIILIILGILSFLIIYRKAGVIGETLSPALGGCLGAIKYIIPFGIFGAAFSIARSGGKFVKSKLFQVLLLLVFIAASFTVYQISSGNIDKSKGFETVVQAAYTLRCK